MCLQNALRSYSLVFDAVYTPKITRLLREAEESGAKIVTGLEMFIGQAYEQFERFTELPGKLGSYSLYNYGSLLHSLGSFKSIYLSFSLCSTQRTLSEDHVKVLEWWCNANIILQLVSFSIVDQFKVLNDLWLIYHC